MASKIAQIETRIEQVMENVLQHFKSEAGASGFYSNKAWTAKLFIELKKAADETGYIREKGYEVCGSGLNADTTLKEDRCYGEWLYDQCWLSWSDAKNQPRLSDVKVVIESEWHTAPHEILNDFEKLPIARADLRVMIFQQQTELEVQNIFNLLCAAIGAFVKSEQGDRYLFCGYVMKERRFICIPYQYEKHSDLSLIAKL